MPNTFESIIAQLQIEICKPLPGISVQMQMAPPIRTPLQKAPSDARLAAVTLLLYPKRGIPYILLMQRTKDAGVHSGQISLPGGKYEDSDLTLTYAALRELEEEMGIKSDSINILGNLTPLYVPPSNFIVMPVLCFSENEICILPNKLEVLNVIELPLAELLDRKNKSIHTVMRSDNKTMEMQTPVYLIKNNLKIWGATAMMLCELEYLIKSKTSVH